jgi:hypothetical protein
MSEKEILEIGRFLNTQGYDLEFDKNGFWMEDTISGETKIKDLAELLKAYTDGLYIPKEGHEKLKQEHLELLKKAVKSGFDNLEDAGSKIQWAFQDKSEFQKLKEENERLKRQAELNSVAYYLRVDERDELAGAYKLLKSSIPELMKKQRENCEKAYRAIELSHDKNVQIRAEIDAILNAPEPSIDLNKE